MNLSEAVAISASSLWAHKLRSVLTLIGVVIGISPWIVEQQHHQAIMWNAVFVGVLVLGLAQLEYVRLKRWEETGLIALALWLIVAAIVSLLTFAGIMLLLSQRISRPLMQITEAVRAVARGDWKSEVSGVERVDEVGDIARAVIVLQRSLEERDRLRSDVAHAESVKKRREALEDAIRRFDRIMRSVLLSVSNSVETMDETARELARVSAVAEGEAVEAASMVQL